MAKKKRKWFCVSINGNLLQEANVNQMLLAFFATFLTLIGIVLVIAITLYILKGIGLMKMAKRGGIKNSWLAFVPVLSIYILGKVAFEDKIMLILLWGLKIFIYSSVVLAFFIRGDLIISILSMILSISQLASTTLSYYAIYKIYDKFSDRAVTMLVLDVLSCGLLEPIFLFAIRNNELRNETAQVA